MFFVKSQSRDTSWMRIFSQKCEGRPSHSACNVLAAGLGFEPRIATFKGWCPTVRRPGNDLIFTLFFLFLQRFDNRQL